MKKDEPDDPFSKSVWRSHRPNGGGSWAAWNTPTKPEPVYIAKDEWPVPKERTDQVFAKSCLSKNWCSTVAGTTTEPASNFGNVMVAGAMLLPDASTAIALLVSGFYPEPNPDNSLHYKKIVPQALIQTVLSAMGWITLADVPMGENDLTQDQVIAVMAVLGDKISRDLMYCMELCR